MPGLFDDLIQEARKGRQPERRAGLFDDLIQQRQQKELTPEEAIRLHDEATGTLEQAKHDVKRSGLNFLQAITASLLSSEDPIADLEASVMATRFGGAAPRPFVRRSTPEEIAAVKRSLADELVKRGQEIRSIPRRPVMEQLGEAESFGETVEAVSRDPLGAVAGISLESSAQMVPTILAGILNPVAGAITAGVTSGLSEQNMAVLEFLANKGMDFSDPDAVVAAFSDPELMQEAEARGLTRGAIIGTLAMLSAGLASKTLVPLRNAVAREAVNIPAQMAVQAAAGGGGEALAQLATEGEITAPGDIVAEIIGETSTAPLDVASFSTGRVREAIERRRDERLIDAIRKEFARMQQEPASSDQQVPSAAEAAPSDSSPVAAEGTVSGAVNPTAPAQAASAPPPAQTPAGIAPTLNTQARPAAEAAPSDSSPVAAEGTVSGVVNPTAPAQAASASPPAQTPVGVAPTLRERAQKALRDITELARRKKEWVFDLELRSGDEDRWLARYATKYMDELPEDTQQFLFGRPAFDQETGATHRIGIVDENDDMGSDGEVHGAHIFNLRMLAEDDTENSNTPSALEEVRELVTPATVEQPNAGQQPLSGPEVEAIPGRIEAGSALGETGAQLEGIAGITPEAATEARRGRRGKGPLDAYADRPVGRSFYTSVFEEAGLDPAQAELLPSDEQFNIVTQQLREKYGFRSIKKEQGHNWREAVDAALDAHQNLQSMAAALGLPIKAMSLDGKIDLQLTKGGDGALAWHVGIPGKGSVVGVSRRNAAFGHEWMHALDHELLERTGARNADLISGRLLTGKLRRGLDLSRAEPNLVEAVSDVLHALYRDDAAKAALVRTLELQLEKATDKQEQDRIRKQLARVRRNQPPESSYYQGAVALDRGKFQTPEAGSDKGYWQRPTEMWARAGEAYIARNIERMGGGTEFVSLRNDQYMQESVEFFEKAYPQKADRERIFAAFDQLFAVIQNLQIFGTEKPPAAARDNAYFNQMDPRLWAASAIPDKWAGLPAYRRLIGRLSDAIKEEAEATRRDAEEVRARLSNSKTGLDQPMLQYIKRLLASSVYSMRGTIMFLKEVYPRSHAINEIFRKLITRPGTGSFTGRTYEEAVVQYANTKGAVLARFVRKHELHKLLPDELRALRDMLTGVRTSGPVHLQLAARDLRFFLDQIWYDVQQAGIDIGYTRNGYLPRIFDHERIEREPHEFLKAATEVYYLMFEDIKDEAAREAQARAAAEDWLFRIRTSGIDSFDRNGIASANFTKGRKLPPEADELLADFMILDPLELIQTYIMQVSRRIAWAERFGANDQGLKALIDQMAKEGMRSEDIKLAVAVIEAATGQRKSLLPRPVQAFLSWLHAIGTVTLLPRAVLNSIAEPATVGLRAGDVRDSFKAFAKTLSALVRTAEGQEMRELAEFLGIISDPLTDQLLANRFGGVFHDPKAATRMLGRFFYRNGLHALTSAQRAGAIPLADAYIRTWCRKLLEGKGGAAVPMLSELGINPSKSLEFAKWLLELGHRPTIEDLEAAPPLMKDLYQTAINRFIDEAIQNVKAVDRPLMTHNPVGRLIFGFTGFLWAFQRNVIMRTIHLFGAALKGKYGGYALSPQERMTAFSLGLIPPIITLLAIHITVSTIREMLFNPDRFEDLGDDFWDRALSGENLTLGLSRSGVAGAFDPLFNAYTGLRYQRDLANVMIGPIPGYVLQSSQEVMAGFQRNSPNTNTAEFNQIKGLYKLAAAPAVNTALTWLPGGPLRSAAYGGLMMALSSPQMATEAAELAVGPKGSETSEGGKRLSAQERREKRREEREKRRAERRIERRAD